MISPSGRVVVVLAAFVLALALNSGGASVAMPGVAIPTRGEMAPTVSTRSAQPANGSWMQLGSGLDNDVLSIVKGSDDTVYFGGGFTSNNAGQTLNRIAAWSPSGQIFAPLANGLDSSIADMVVSRDDTLYIGGYFTTAVGGPSLAGIGAWSARTQSYTPVGPGMNSHVSSLALQDDTLYLSGNFSTYVGGPANSLRKMAQWGPITSGGGFAPVGGGLDFDAQALHFPASDDTLYLGGWFSQEVGGAANGLRFVAQWGPLASGGSYDPLGTGLDSLVFTMDSGNDDSIFVGGQFTSSIGGAPLRNIAAWRSGATSDAGYAPLGLGLDNRVDHIAVDDSHSLVYAGGLFSYACGDVACAASHDDTVLLNGVAVFDRRTQSWSPMSAGGGVGVMNSGVFALLRDGSSLYVGGAFTQTGSGTPLARAARWTWNPPSGSQVISNPPGTAVTIEGTGLIGVDSVTVGGLAAPIDYSTSSGTSITITLPGGLGPGSHAIVADAVGGLGAIASYVVAGPSPPPATPSDPPTSVSAVPADAAAVVTWAAPASAGSFPVTNYLATSSPDGRTCLVAAPALTCEVTGLANGAAYTFTVKALTGAGWSPASDRSNAVVPRPSADPSIVITGTREGKRIEVSGSTTGFGMGAILNPWVKLAGQSAYLRGAAQVLVSMDGTFEWSRRSGKKASIYMQTPDGAVRSNTVVIAAR